MRSLKVAGCVVLMLTAVVFSAMCQGNQEPQAKQDKLEDFAGEFAGWGVKVPAGNYNFVKGAVVVFGNRWGAQAQTAEELEGQVWEQLVLSYEAFNRNIQVDEKKVEEEIGKIMKEEKADFDWQKDQEKYNQWIKERTRSTPELFKNHLRHLMQLDELRKTVLDTFKPEVSEQEAKDEFINEYNTIELELLQFDALEEAQSFYKKAKNAKAWEKEVKKASAKDPKFAKHPGFVSFEFLINMWKIPKDDLYKMLGMDIDSIYPPVPIYKGYGIFRILKKRPADPAEFPKMRDAYIKQVESLKKYEQLQAWITKLKEDAKVNIFPKAQAVPAVPVQEGK